MNLLCPNCGTQCESGKFCPECGSKLQEVTPEFVCSSCGYKAKSGKFCPECGTKLTEQLASPNIDEHKEPIKRTFNEKDPRFAKYYDKKGFPRTIPQEERDVAIEELTPFVDQNIAEAKMLLANILSVSGEENAKKGFSMLKEAEQAGDKFAYYLMGYVYFLEGQNYNEAEKRMLEMYKEYENGDVAQLLAELYTFSADKCDYKKAFDYATIAAEDEERGGYSILGVLYLNGWGVEKNVNLALENYKMAAAHGDEAAMNQIGIIFMGNEEIEANPEQSFYWFNEAAKKGSDVGMYNLACCYRDGFGIEVDVEIAAEWFKKSAELDYLDAMCELGGYYQDSLIDPDKAKMWYLKAAELGHVEAQNKLGIFYANIENDYKEAIKWYKKAMEQDYPNAYRNYAFCLWNGDGVKENKKKAMEMMQKAISLGHPDAEEDLKEMQQELANSKNEDVKESQSKNKEIKEKTEAVIIENVNFSTDGRNNLFIEFECEYNQKWADGNFVFGTYVNNILLDFELFSSGNGSQLSKKREKFKYKIEYLKLKLHHKEINNVSFLIEVRLVSCTGFMSSSQLSQIFKTSPLKASYKKELKLYHEFHFLHKNILEIR